MPLIHFDNLGHQSGMVHGVTTRRGPAFGQVGTDEATELAARECARLLGMRGTAWAHQVHGDTILQVDRSGLAGQADALISRSPGLLLAGRSADCPIILIAGHCPDGQPVVAFAHASWRSTVLQISRQVVTRLVDEMNVDPATLWAAIAPSAGPCCYEVGPEVRDQARAQWGPTADQHFPYRNQQLFFDLWSANRHQLVAAGVPDSQVENKRICTICQGSGFWSWRRQRERAGRFAGLIGIKMQPCQIAFHHYNDAH